MSPGNKRKFNKSILIIWKCTTQANLKPVNRSKFSLVSVIVQVGREQRLVINSRPTLCRRITGENTVHKNGSEQQPSKSECHSSCLCDSLFDSKSRLEEARDKFLHGMEGQNGIRMSTSIVNLQYAFMKYEYIN